MQRPVPSQGPEPGSQTVPQGPPQPPQGAGQTPPGYAQQPQFQQGFYPPYGQRFGGPPPPFPPGPGFPPYGAPPGWYPPPPGHGFPPGPGQFAPPMPMAPGQQPGPQRPGPPSAAPGSQPTSELPAGDKAPSKTNSRNATPAAQNAPPPPVESKPSVAEVQASVGSAPAPVPHKSGRVMPAIPIAAPKAAPRANNQPITDATAAATAAVAAAMAKLPQPGAQKPDAPIDALTQQMSNMRPYDGARGGRGGHHHQNQHQHQPQHPHPHQHARGGRGGARHHNQHQHQQHKKIEVPQSDYDFETANAKFNKQDLVKEAIATGVPAAEAEAHAEEVESQDTANHAAASSNSMYSRSSFFDNISSEARDREENTARVGGREWRGEEEKRNMETFGQGSVDGYRPNYRGRGRGRGYGRGRGGYSRGYGRGRGGRAQSESTGVPSQG